jgi:hypothetical protein
MILLDEEHEVEGNASIPEVEGVRDLRTLDRTRVGVASGAAWPISIADVTKPPSKPARGDGVKEEKRRCDHLS